MLVLSEREIRFRCKVVWGNTFFGPVPLPQDEVKIYVQVCVQIECNSPRYHEGGGGGMTNSSKCVERMCSMYKSAEVSSQRTLFIKL